MVDGTVRTIPLSAMLRGMAANAEALAAERDAALTRIAELEAAAPPAFVPLRVLQPRTMAQLKTICTATAEPGDLIDLGGLTFSDGGTLKITRSGTQEHPIVFSNGIVQRRPGGPTAQIDGSWLVFEDVLFRDGSKVVQVRGSHLVFSRCAFQNAGDELVKIYNGAVDVEFVDCDWTGAGLVQPDIGEALYVGEHPSSTLARVADVRVFGGQMRNFTAEGIDMKEGALGLSVIGTVIDCSQQVGVSFAGYAGIAIKGTLVNVQDVTIIRPRVAGVVTLASANKPLWDVQATAWLEHITVQREDGRAQHVVENRSGTPYLVQRDCDWAAA